MGPGNADTNTNYLIVRQAGYKSSNVLKPDTIKFNDFLRLFPRGGEFYFMFRKFCRVRS